MLCIALVLRILEKRRAEDQNTTDFHWKKSKPYRNGYSGSRTKMFWKRLLTESMVPVQAGRMRRVFVVPFVQLAVAPGRLWFGWKGCSVPSTAACEIWGVSQKQKLSRNSRQVLHFPFVPDLGLVLLLPSKLIRATHLPRHPSSSWAWDSNEMCEWVDQIHGLL